MRLTCGLNATNANCGGKQKKKWRRQKGSPARM